ncbi:tetratricopeptide repeat-containing sensor histidine kinase [Polaribacter cellanae]|uniref:Sensor histidine kinase n=1 Tax=Polaribacter cellanae TaxID=2818493 RepID=A0A975CPB5_9FLAO|nr:sensor histidine kinase [Polaribacter cellanae]QTE22999.1 sensor histidine kinase [Polaribacter cellanae]
MKYLLFFFLFFLVTISQAQNSDIKANVKELKRKIQSEKNKTIKLKLLDSLTAEVRNKTNFAYDSIAKITINYAIELDSLDIAAYNVTNLINYYNNFLGKPKAGIEIFNKYFNTLKNHITNRNLASLYIDSGDSYYFLKQVDSAISRYNKAKEFAKKAADERIMGFALLYKGYAYSDEGNFVKASQTLQKALKIFYKVKDTFNIIASKNTLAILYSSNEFLEEAKQERSEAIFLAEKMKSYGQLISMFVNEANDNKKEGLEKKRIHNLYKALEASKKSKYINYYNPILLNALVIAYAENDSIKKAKKYVKELEKNKQNTEGIYEADYYKALKKVAFSEKKYVKAQQFGLKHLKLVKASNKIKSIQNAQAFLAKVFEKLKKTDLAFSYYKASKKIEDSIQSVQKTKSLAYYQTLYETAKRDQEIKEQNNKIHLLNEQNKRKTQLIGFGGVAALALFSLIYLWRTRKFSIDKARLQKIFAQDLIRNIEAEKKRISSELHDSVGQSLLLIKNKIFLDSKKQTDTNLVDSAIDEVRSISQQLHPFKFEKLGLIKSVKNTVNNFQKNSQIFYSEDLEIDTLNISKDKEIFIFRMIQECLNNVEKHSQAKACNVSVENKKDSVIFQIKDNGIGFDVTENSMLLNSLGMKTLKERAQIIGAQLYINSIKGKGTTIQIKVSKK